MDRDRDLFVTRLKANAQFEVVVEREPPPHRHILKEQTIRLTGPGAQEKCPHVLRRVEAVREETGILVFLTNQHDLGASTISAVYKNRGQLELFFKAPKQNLKIKTFVGTSANAVKTQIWTALMAMLLLRYLANDRSLRLEPGQSGGTVAHESLHPSGSHGLARGTLRDTAPSASLGSNDHGARVILDSRGGMILKWAQNSAKTRFSAAAYQLGCGCFGQQLIEAAN